MCVKIINDFLNSVYLFIFGMFYFKPRMETSEIVLLMKYLHNAVNYLEFGLGGSTCLACNYSNIKNIYTVEASEKWIELLKKYSLIQNHLSEKKIIIDYIDINGDDDNWSYPKNDVKKHNWKNYYNPWNSISFKPDFILIDGRFRVACLLHCLLNIYNTDHNCVIGIHDYSIRDHYHIVEKFLNILEYKETLYIFTIRVYIDIKDIKCILYNYENDTR